MPKQRIVLQQKTRSYHGSAEKTIRGDGRQDSFIPWRPAQDDEKNVPSAQRLHHRAKK